MRGRIYQDRRVIAVQPALPQYRIDFFDRVSATLRESFVVYHSPESMGVLTSEGSKERWARAIGPILRPFAGVEWQVGALSVPVRRGDIVVISGGHRCLSNIALLLKAKAVRAKTIWWGQYWSSTSRMWRLLLRLWLMKMADAVLFYTDTETEAYRRTIGCRDKRLISALNNGLDVAPIREAVVAYKARERDRAGLFVGRITDKSNMALLIRALAQPVLAGFHLHILGDGPKKEQMQQLAQELGVAERIVWHAGTIDEARIADVANRCRLFVYPGSVGLSLIHAMAYGLPAVVHDNRQHHMPEIAAFQDGGNGRAFREGSSASLAYTIAELVDNEPLLDQMSSSSFTMAHSRHNTEVMAGRFLACVNTLDATSES